MKKHIINLSIISFIAIMSIFAYFKYGSVNTSTSELVLLNVDAIADIEQGASLSGPTRENECGGFIPETESGCEVRITWCESSKKDLECGQSLCNQHQTQSKNNLN